MNAAAPLTPSSPATPSAALLLCFSHLRWNFVFQRPQHLMTRLARRWPVVFWEEPEIGGDAAPTLAVRSDRGVRIATPRLPAGMSEVQMQDVLTALLSAFLAAEPPVAIRWY